MGISARLALLFQEKSGNPAPEMTNCQHGFFRLYFIATSQH
jgi:hypothetical protein